LGEEVCNVKQEFREIYFGLKNIILKDIDNSNETDLKGFFLHEFSSGNLEEHISESRSAAFKSAAITPVEADIEEKSETTFSQVALKRSARKQEVVSKY